MKTYIETRTSKLGKEYKVLVIELTPNYKKYVFLTKAELELIELVNI